ncbi:hypothetical protein [Sphingobium boeckii]|uniref:Uncharacterized protein n=1 Tax=Sphingobium boeckii TaxID=1082345 RepID=A0A7W9AKD8_9SPHN|nr:hypothetical protein [Sphingobium boeckii]
MHRFKPLIVCSLIALLAGCAKDGDIDATGGITVTRTACPAVGIPQYTGDITVFDPVTSRAASAIDVVASITNLRSTCSGDTGADVVTNATFDVLATRRNTSGARQVTLPYFSTVIRGGRAVIAKRLGRITLDFADGQARASVSGSASSVVNRAAATLPDDIQKQITKKRKPGDADAAIDPLALPAVKEAVSRASFELLIGFQLTSDQLQYNATR